MDSVSGRPVGKPTEYDVVGEKAADIAVVDDNHAFRGDRAFDAYDPEFRGLSLYEKKSLMINRELDRQGMGRYQWYIWGLCGLGYLLDLMWAQAFGLVSVPIQQEFGFSDAELGNIFSSFSAGLTAGAFVWGVLVDIIGRKWAFNGTVLIACIFGLCLGAPDTYDTLLVLTAFTGFGIGGNIPIDTTICLEFLPQNRRFLLTMLSIFQPIGVVACSGIAYGFIPFHSCGVGLPACNSVSAGTACCTKASNYGWRYLMFTVGAITLTVFLLRFVLFRFQESPKFLLSKGKDEAALTVLRNIAKTNKKECSVTQETFDALKLATNQGVANESDGSGTPVVDLYGAAYSNASPMKKAKHELQRLRILFSTPTLIRLTLLVWITYAFDYWGFSIAGSFLPKILSTKNRSISVSVQQTYLDYVIIYLPGILGVALGGFMVYVPRFGRKWAMVFSSALMAISLFLFATVNNQAANIGLNCMEYFFQSMFNAVLYGWTPEAFPAPVRGTASGIASFWGRLFSIFSPLIAAHLLETNLDGPLYLAGAGVLICTIAILFLPSKTMGAQSI